MLGGETGNALETVILASSVLYELIGPAAAKLSLYLSHSYSTNLEEITSDVPLTSDGVPKTPVEILTERIKKIQSELPAHSEPAQSEEEQAFLEAAEEQYAAMGAMGRRRGFINRK